MEMQQVNHLIAGFCCWKTDLFSIFTSVLPPFDNFFFQQFLKLITWNYYAFTIKLGFFFSALPTMIYQNLRKKKNLQVCAKFKTKRKKSLKKKCASNDGIECD
jgi:hypothetical protein